LCAACVFARPLNSSVRRHLASDLAIALAALLALFVAFPVALFFALRWPARRWLKRHQSNPLAVTIRPSGVIVYTCLIVAMTAMLSVYQLQPDSRLGTFLHQPGGLVTAILVLAIVSGVVEAVLRRLGHPTTRAKRDV
jgi:drug/metabolite transporter (DMT)-like permease